MHCHTWRYFFFTLALLKHKLTPQDVDYVVCTSGLPDKVGNLNLFTRAKHIVSGVLCFNDNFFQHAFKQVGIRIAISLNHGGES